MPSLDIFMKDLKGMIDNAINNTLTSIHKPYLEEVKKTILNRDGGGKSHRRALDGKIVSRSKAFEPPVTDSGRTERDTKIEIKRNIVVINNPTPYAKDLEEGHVMQIGDKTISVEPRPYVSFLTEKVNDPKLFKDKLNVSIKQEFKKRGY